MRVYVEGEYAEQIGAGLKGVEVVNKDLDKEPVKSPGFGTVIEPEQAQLLTEILKNAQKPLGLIVDLGKTLSGIGAAWKVIKYARNWARNRKIPNYPILRYTKPEAKWMVHIHAPEDASWYTRIKVYWILKGYENYGHENANFVDIHYYWDTKSKQFMQLTEARS